MHVAHLRQSAGLWCQKDGSARMLAHLALLKTPAHAALPAPLQAQALHPHALNTGASCHTDDEICVARRLCCPCRTLWPAWPTLTPTAEGSPRWAQRWGAGIGQGTKAGRHWWRRMQQKWVALRQQMPWTNGWSACATGLVTGMCGWLSGGGGVEVVGSGV